MKVGNLLKKYNLYDERIKNINYHLDIFTLDAEYLVFKVLGIKNLTEKELANILLELINKCDMKNPYYDAKIDEEMTRIGIGTDKFYGGHNHNIWNNNNFSDDGFGFGTEPTSLYDDYIDSQSNGRSR